MTRLTQLLVFALSAVLSLQVPITCAAIATGTYFVRNVSTGKYIGRASIEDRSLLPKRIVNLSNPSAGQPYFVFEALDSGQYKIFAAGGRLVPIEGMAFAALLPDPYPDAAWSVKNVSDKGHYTIAFSDKELLTVVDSEDLAQVELQSASGPSDSQLWTLEDAE